MRAHIVFKWRQIYIVETSLAKRHPYFKKLFIRVQKGSQHDLLVTLSTGLKSQVDWVHTANNLVNQYLNAKRRRKTTLKVWDWRDGSAVKSIEYMLIEDPNPVLRTHRSQPPVTWTPRVSNASGLYGHLNTRAHTHRTDTHTWN